MKRIVFISDFFVEHIIGGGELNDHELINMFLEEKTDVIEKELYEWCNGEIFNTEEN